VKETFFPLSCVNINASDGELMLQVRVTALYFMTLYYVMKEVVNKNNEGVGFKVIAQRIQL
jgi:hypothetical protein